MFFFKELKLLQKQRASFNLLASLVLVSMGMPFWSPVLAAMTGAFGYALFWRGLLQLTTARFGISFGWFLIVQLIQISWLARTDYLGPLILGVYVFVAASMALQFACLSSLIRLPMSWRQAAGLSGLWVFFEWVRLFPLNGFPWNPVAFVLNHPWSIVCASFFGVFGLSFWVMLTNLMALKQRWMQWICLALAPYMIGLCFLQWHDRSPDEVQDRPLAALVQTALLPSQKYATPQREHEYVPALIQWDRIIEQLKVSGREAFDWIVLPEGAVPYRANHAFYAKNTVQQLWVHHFGPKAVSDLPKAEGLHVDNAFWAKAISNHFHAEVIIGLDDKDQHGDYNAAFRFPRNDYPIERYEKQILIPVAEWVPFPFWEGLREFFSEQFGIQSSFTSGKKPGLFGNEVGVLICLEEAYGELARVVRRLGAKCLVSISNDAWYPRSFLTWAHLEQGRLRAAENGVPLLRCCNTGVTAMINCFGQVTSQIPPSETEAGILVDVVPMQQYKTFYTFWGDAAILLISGCFFASYLWKRLLEYRALD